MDGVPVGNGPFEGMSWDHAPLRWELEETSSTLTVWPREESDNWCRTHYGWGVHDSAHFLSRPFPDDKRAVQVEVVVQAFPLHNYDQAGLMIRRGPGSWIKCAAEYDPRDGSSRLGAVVTNHGYSDWSTQKISLEVGTPITYRVTKYQEHDVMIQARIGEGHWQQLRISRLFPLTSEGDHDLADLSLFRVGLYCCSPAKEGFRAVFSNFSVSFLDGTPSD